jgi:hypothetical protein
LALKLKIHIKELLRVVSELLKNYLLSKQKVAAEEAKGRAVEEAVIKKLILLHL